MSPVQASDALGLSQHELQDVVTSLLLSETAYKAAEGPPAAAVAALTSLQRQFPPGLAPLERIQFSRRRSAGHRFLLAASPTTLFVAFMGTKQLRDVLADANLGTALLWAEAEAVAEAAPAIGEQGSEDQPSGTQAASAAVTAATAAGAAVAPAQAAAPGVHRGFLGRAQAVQVEPLWVHARQQGLRLVLCGHSLGGAVAQLCTLRLLHLLRAAPPPADSLRCIVFGCPAIGNTALADHVRQQAWDAHFLSISLPEDVIPRLLLLAQATVPSGAGAAAATALAEGSQAAHALSQDKAVRGQQQRQGQGRQAQHEQQHAQQHEQQQQAQQQQEQQHEQHLQGVEPPSLKASTDTDSSSSVSPTRSGWLDGVRAAALLARRPLTATADAAAGAARSALEGAGRLQLPALLPAFAHIGHQRHLLPHGLVPVGTSSPGAAAAAAAAAAAVAVADAAAVGEAANHTSQAAPRQQQASQAVGLQLLGLHSMQHYRSRAAAVCWAALGGVPAAAGLQQDDTPVMLSHSLAPAVTVAAAVARLPVLPLPVVHQPQQRQQQQGRTPLSVAVHGSGLESCTGALLRLPASESVQLAATSVVNLAYQRLLLDMQGGHSSSSGGGPWRSTRSARLLAAAAGATRRAAAHGLGRLPPLQQQRQQQQQQHPQGPPALLLRFSVPAAALAQLQLQEGAGVGGGWRLPEGSLVLLSDFTRHTARVQLQPQVVWMLGADERLAASVFRQLKAAGKAAAAGPEVQRARRFNPATLRSGLAVAAGGGRLWGRRAEGGTHSGEAEAKMGEDASASGASPMASAGGGVPAAPAPSSAAPRRLASLGRHLVRVARAQWFAGEQQPPAAPAALAALLRGQLLLDATPAVWGGVRSNKIICGISSSSSSSSSSVELVQQLEAAAAVVRWAGSRRHHSAEAGIGQRSGAWDDFAQAEDEDIAELHHLGLAARLRRSVVQASQAARRRIVLSGKWRGGLSDLPAPNLLVLVVSHQQLLSGQYGRGLESSVLAAVRRLTAACHAVGAPLLLLVGSHTPLSTPTRHQLAHSCGLVAGSGEGGSRRGGVVPLLHPRSTLESVQVGPLAAALYAFGSSNWQQHDTAELHARL